MNPSNSFIVASNSQRVAGWIFWLIAAISVVLILCPASGFDCYLQPVLVVLSIGGLISGFVTMIYQNRGNHFLRASQLTNSLGVPVGDELRTTYYNNDCPPSIVRLAATTMENSLFTSEVLAVMLRSERTKTAGYLVLFVWFLAYRNTSLNWVVLMAQSVFSADIILNWLKMERFRFRAWEVHKRLHDLFLHGSSPKKQIGIAVILAAFSDYECAKDEAAMVLDGKVFEKLNPSVSARWEDIKRNLKIG